ncbi:MAG: D-alanyl-D-alanine carboxypeptidase/D-alanyl-D-alanine-endopeptidase [Bacteroidetes bacterium]|nr:D-alanyl-D-alanine carboxypeptidase/D-alanyl-D-alanine-endopeptidase [Bacteroidota bacterium]
MKFWIKNSLVILLAGILVVPVSAKSAKSRKSAPAVPKLSSFRIDDVYTDSIKYQIVADLLDKTLRQKAYRKTRFGIQIQDELGNPVFSLNSNFKLKPASTLKIVTTAVALEKLGPDFRYKTVISTDGELENGILDGNLIIHGTADPQLSGYFDGEVISITSAWANQIQEMGISKITGSVFLDNSYYADENGNVKTRFVTVAMFDQAAKSQLTQTVKNKKGKEVKRKIRLRRSSSRKLVQVNMNQYLGNLLTSELYKRNLIETKEAETDFDLPKDIHLSALIVHESDPLSEIITRTNKKSDNFYADQLVRTLGYEFLGTGNIEAGIRVIEGFLRFHMNINESEYDMTDGSGLSHDNQMSAKVLTRILSYMSTSTPNRDYFYNSLSIPTVDGTLANRIHHPLAENMRGKTGSISGVVSLTGYISSNSGKNLVFSIMCNGGSSRRLKSLEDEICKLLLNL